jgi:FAD/FMN-containing dehydrogenase/Fe-S oxidoreductase
MIPQLTHAPGLEHQVLQWLTRLRRTPFSGDIETSLAARLAVATDNSVYEILPQAVVFPKSAADVAVVMQTLDTPETRDIQIVPRGGGTGTNGQSLAPGIVVDLSRHMRKIGQLDLLAGTVHVEPGVVLDDLNCAVASHGYFFGPTLSPSDRATLGGMIGTNACGKGSRIYGRTVDHIEELEVVLADGTLVVFSDEDTAAAHRAANRPDLLGSIYRNVLDTIGSESELIEEFWPRMPRTPGGYNLRQVLSRDGSRFSLVPIICGSEGTLGIVVGAKLRLTPIPKCKRLLVLRFAQFNDALASAESLVRANPSAIETIDERILQLVRTDPLWHRLSHLFADDEKTRAINLVEFAGDDSTELDANLQRLVEQLPAPGSSASAPLDYLVPNSAADIAALWELRKKGVGLLGKMKGDRRPIPFVEDTAVPPAKLADYVREFRAILDAEGLQYGMFGHVDVGCLHVRPALDLRDPEDALRLRRISDKIAILVKSYGGVLWGEHGTGFRSEYSPDYFGPRLFAALCRIKSAFDPRGKLNRGKLALAANHGHVLVSIDDNHRAALDRDIAPVAQQHFSEALFCNGNGQCFSSNSNVVMCPSSKVTRNRIHSPKGRATLIRHWLRQLGSHGSTLANGLAQRQYPPDFAPLQLLERWDRRRTHNSRYDYSHEVFDGLNGCLSCKACTTQCPIEVDIPRMKSEFLSVYHERYPRPLVDYLLASLEWVVQVVGRLPRLFNTIMRGRVSRWLMKRFAGLVDIPELGLGTVKAGYKQRKLGRFDYEALSRLSDEEKARTVLIVQDSFTTFFEPEVVLGVTDLLLLLGYRPILVPFRPNGKALHVKGFLRTFTALVDRNVERLNAIAALGISLIGLEPAITLTYRDEYPHALGVAQLPFDVKPFQSWLAEKLDDLGNIISTSGRLSPPIKNYTLLGHCTERTAAPLSQKDWQRVFAAFGLTLELAELGCCGMCGVYGHEQAHADESRGIYELSWKPRLDLAESRDEHIVVAGFSCRHQIKRLRNRKAQHPVFALLESCRQLTLDRTVGLP